jgi:hypothetical protein
MARPNLAQWDPIDRTWRRRPSGRPYETSTLHWRSTRSNLPHSARIVQAPRPVPGVLLPRSFEWRQHDWSASSGCLSLAGGGLHAHCALGLRARGSFIRPVIGDVQLADRRWQSRVALGDFITQWVTNRRRTPMRARSTKKTLDLSLCIVVASKIVLVTLAFVHFG